MLFHCDNIFTKYLIENLMIIEPQPIDVITFKLSKIRCCSGCLNPINYLVFGHGLYCSSCLSSLPDLTPDHFVNLDGLANLILDVVNQYQQRSRGQTSQLTAFKSEMETLKKDVRKNKDMLSFDLKSVKDKSLATLDQLFLECLKENQNQPLQGFYQPDITATLILNQSELLLKNVNNLKAEEAGGKVNYKIKEGHKNAEKINKKVQREYHQLNQCIESSLLQCQGIISSFLAQIEGNSQ